MAESLTLWRPESTIAHVRHWLALTCGVMMVSASGCAPLVQVRVADCGTKAPIVAAKVRVMVDSVPHQDKQTDATGKTTVRLPVDNSVMSITAKGYAQESSMYGRVPSGTVKICLQRSTR